MKCKKIIAVISSALLIGGIAATSAFADSAQSKPSLVALGDSITFGYNLGNNHHPSKDAFPFLIAHEDDYRVRDLGVPGDTSEDLLNKLQKPQYLEAIRHADAITLDIGSNDFLLGAKDIIAKIRQGGVLAPSDLARLQAINVNFVNNLTKIMTTIQTTNSQAKIVLYTIYNPIEGFDITAAGLLQYANKSIQAYANLNSVAVADAFAAFYGKQSTLILPNDVHPNEDGQALLAEIGLEALESLK